ncbi:glutamate--cysteine ligase regulatory subunit-like [Watersipora subatra]|uniref:glutamate--cysteine ligase regulatory subunit-like n=1 Tax=Watersipora subatra TaxID=2589382 RepID=UPI00355C5295
MADDSCMPMIPKAGSIYVHTGNICTWDRLKRKVNQKPNFEVYECLGDCMQKAIANFTKSSLQYEHALNCCGGGDAIQPCEPQDLRADLKLTAKVFLSTPTGEALQDAITHIKSDLAVTYIDNLLISFPSQTDELSIQQVWAEVEVCIGDGVVIQGGVSDMDRSELEALYDWAQVKPSTNQVNLTSCCVMPPELVEFAKEHDIQLLTHNDPQEILTKENLSQLLSENLTARDAEGWNLQYVVRYTNLVKLRGVIRSKGYLMRALRDVRGKRSF